ncbi:MAG: GIY-YIG nuclease family protein [Candidatus Omnitrophota bacterium]
MFFVYVLQSEKDKDLYIGFSENFERRCEEHNKGQVDATKHRRPLNLIYYEAYLEKNDALGRELFLKSGSGHKFLKHQLRYFFRKNDRGVEQPGSSQGS